ncbi:MAG: NAD(P)/FAD-dependent oxidoreductase [Alicyclobacillus macrosporangiidus]|uniref:NAD(P)/FAD-dependent oxidoreductase n=1 Tax=Alicyclobacillus macrosporangiidus TaxID=392015 RepID=UPI0026EA8BA4|nr:NAD(P)/FAD-dependent oxidoreductase [Alicyclobacillus macrosporangiidus]MCL6598216.1 NAD(P)/FAD-dependent oxidoreductase [Alicyclobacillus macrosporangiidus]
MADILILGAGYAGMMAATGLDRISEPFTLVNNHEYHYFTTLLHEAAGGRGEPMKYTVPIRDMLRKPSSRFVQDEIVRLDRARRVAIGKSGEYPYELLVVALGWVPEYFGIPGLAEHSLVLRNIDTAIQIRRHIESQFEAYKKDGDSTHLRIVVGGAGLTGIELVGELVDWIPELCVRYGIDRSAVEIQNIEAMPTILPQVSPELREVAARTLTEKGARLRTNTKIVKVEAGEVHVEGDDPVRAGTIIWTGGVRAHPLLSEAGFTVDRRGRAKVDAYLRSVDDDHVFVGGDTAWFEDEEGKPLPPTAQVATQMGHCIAENVSSAVHGHPLKVFRPSIKGTLASLGREVGVGNIGKFPVKGFLAGLAKEATKVKYFWELGGLRLTAEKTGEIVHLT